MPAPLLHFPSTSLGDGLDCPPLRTASDHYPYIDPSKLARYLSGWGLIELPLRASNEGSPRPRVARAQKIIRLHPPIRLK